MSKRLEQTALVAISLAAGAGCVSDRYAYKYRMVEPAPPSDAMVIDDGNAKIEFAVLEKSSAFTVANKSQDPVSVLWDESSIVIGGEAKKIFHEGVKYTNRMEHQPPSVVPPGARLSDSATPTENAFYASEVGWMVRNLFPTVILTGSGTEEARREIEGNVDKEFTLYLALDRSGQRTNYTARFRIESVSKIESK